MVKEEPTPNIQTIKEALPIVDYQDTFAVTNHQDSIEEITRLIFGRMPGWAKALFTIRNYLVKFFGLKTDISTNNNHFVEGAYIGFFKIYHIYAHGVLMGVDDKHLNFRVSIYNSSQKYYNIKCSTLVQYNNSTGKIYMTLIKPFHRLIVKAMLKNAHIKNNIQ